MRSSQVKRTVDGLLPRSWWRSHPGRRWGWRKRLVEVGVVEP